MTRQRRRWKLACVASFVGVLCVFCFLAARILGRERNGGRGEREETPLFPLPSPLPPFFSFFPISTRSHIETHQNPQKCLLHRLYQKSFHPRTCICCYYGVKPSYVFPAPLPYTVTYTDFNILNAPINVKPEGGGVGLPTGI